MVQAPQVCLCGNLVSKWSQSDLDVMEENAWFSLLKMLTCAVLSCGNRSDTKNVANGGMSYFRFPQDPMTKENWINCTAKKNWVPRSHDTLCSGHFDAKNVTISPKGRKYLIDKAVPTKGILMYHEEVKVLSILWTIFSLETSECSEVTDAMSQRGLYISDYCPKIGSCNEGSHVMCMYYNPNSIMGPKCSNPRNITVTPDIAHEMLDIVNAVRSKLARGKETGKEGIKLPRGYGIFRLKWDSELATFAQVLANQCVMRHDLCRASKKFSDPGQSVGLVRFTMPHWNPFGTQVKFNKTGLTIPKIHYAITQSLKSWYSHKEHVTPDMIRNYTDWNRYPPNINGRLYLEMIDGTTTHMGCGVTAFSEYAYYDNRATMTFYSIQIICNFSSRPRTGKAVYQTTQPTEPGYTTRCGCPEGSEEDAECLCSEIPSPLEMCGKKSCSPNVVLLPIFTVEDVPRSMLLDEQSRESSIAIPNSYRRNNSASMAVKDDFIDDVFGPFESYGNSVDRTTGSPVLNPMMHYVQPQHTSSGVKVKSEPHFQSPYLRSTTNSQHLSDVKNRYFSKNISDTSQRRPQTGISHVQNREPTLRMRPSIFSRYSTFHLPRDTFTNSFSFRSDIKRDVAPIKDFTKRKEVLSTYLSKKRNHENTSYKAPNFDITPYVIKEVNITPRFIIIETTGNYNKPSKNFNRYLKTKFHYQDFNLTHRQRNDIEIKNSNEEADMKLKTLLDTLEQEVNHIELIGIKKEIFDAKMRKIYDTVLNKKKETNLKSPLHTRDFTKNTRDLFHKEIDQEDAGYNTYVKYETDVKNHLAVNHKDDDQSKDIMDKIIYKCEKKANEITPKLFDGFSDPKSMFLKKTKEHNSLLPIDENDTALVRHYKEPFIHDSYDAETEDGSYSNNFDRNETLDKSMMRYSYTNKNAKNDDDPKIKNHKDIGQEINLRERENNLRNAEKIHDDDAYPFYNRNLFKKYEIKPRNEDKNYDNKVTKKRYDEDVKNRHLDIELKNRDFDKTIDNYRRTKKRSSDDNVKNKNHVSYSSLKSRNIHRNNEGRSRHNYDDELMKRHNYNENVLRRNVNVMPRDRRNEFRSRAIVNEMRSSKSYKDCRNKKQEVSHSDTLGLERRNFYQYQIDNLEKKLYSRNYRRRSEHDTQRGLRLDRPRQDELHMRPSSKGQHQFIPDRTRILHGF